MRIAPATCLFACLALTACGDAAMDDYPRLVPAEAVLAEPALPAHAAADPDAVARDLRAGQRALQAAAAEPTPPVMTPDLATRTRALQARAAALRCDSSIETGPACPP